MTQTHLLLEGPIMTQMLLPPGSLIVILQVYLLGEVIMVPQVSLPPEGPITTPLTQPNIGGLLTLQNHSISGRPVMTPLIWNCPEPKVVKLQKDPRGSWDPPTRHSPRTASLAVTLTFLHGSGKQKLILELRSSLIPKVSIWLMHKRSFVPVSMRMRKITGAGSKVLCAFAYPSSPMKRHCWGR